MAKNAPPCARRVLPRAGCARPAGGTREHAASEDESAVSKSLSAMRRSPPVCSRRLPSTSGMLHLVEAALALRDSPGDNGLDGGLGLARLVLRVTHGLILGGSVVYCLANATKVQEAMQDVELVSTRTVAASTRQLRHAAALTRPRLPARARGGGDRPHEASRARPGGAPDDHGSKGRRQDRHGRARLSPVTWGADRPEASQ